MTYTVIIGKVLRGNTAEVTVPKTEKTLSVKLAGGEEKVTLTV